MVRKLGIAGVIGFGCLASVLFSSGATAGQSLSGAITHGKPSIQLRLRSETVDDENCGACAGRAASATTARARVGYETAAWYHLKLLAEVDGVLATGPYNNTRNGRSLYPVVADPNLFVLNRLQLSYALGLDTKIVLGRQRIKIGNDRFVGNVGWRDHEQTYDAFRITNGSIRNLSVTYAYIDRVNRIFGPASPIPAGGQPSHFDSRSHIVDATFVGIQGLKLEGYAFILDLKQPGPNPAPARNLSTSTLGLRAEEKVDLTPKVKVLFKGEYAHQSDHAGNPLSLSLNYWFGEAGFAYKGLTVTGAFESLGSNGTNGFTTPLATLHAFNGWADIFLATPAKGLNDAYGKLVYKKKNVAGLKAVTTTVMYHDFSAARGGADYGNEWDVSLGASVNKHVSLLAKYADFDGKGTFHDKSVFWLQAEYKY